MPVDGLLCALFENWRRVEVVDNHAAAQWAEGARRLVQEDYPQAKRIIWVGNLNTHAGASL
ncbi:hypothetical protein [Methylomicrobium agile]|uniref:hypothetical protein n=1 Tax=Methylomicrobium agile TaxID=39774 RepID=UPI000686A7D1|nr:hypothetical protein [Methylomicrobium agile]